MSACHAGWNSTSSRRLPYRSWVWSTGGFALACSPHAIGSPPQNVPAAWTRSRAQFAPSRSSASASARLSAKRSRHSSGGAWFATSCVAPWSLRASVDMGGGLPVGDGAQAEGDEVGDERVGVGVRGDLRQRPDERFGKRADERGARELRVLRRQLAGVDAVGDDRGEVLGVGAAEAQALGLDGGGGGLGEAAAEERGEGRGGGAAEAGARGLGGGVGGRGERGVGRAAGLQRTAREGLDGGGEAGGRAGVGGGGGGGGLALAGRPPPEDLGE